MKTIVEYATQLEKPYIDAKIGATQSVIAPVEASTTSSAAYAVDDQLILNGVLYKVTAAIAIGDTITVGTNVAVADKLVDQIANTYLEQNITLSTTSEVTATFTSSDIHSTSAIDVYTSNPLLTYKTMNISEGSCTVTFDKQDDASTVTVRIYIK